MLSPNSRLKAQGFGRFLSSIVMPNLSAFIAWGLISALFIPSGWMPNSELAALVEPMLFFLLPLLIGYTGGRLVSGERGAVVGAIAVMGLIVGSDVPMLMGAMIVGPLAGWVIKCVDEFTQKRTKTGFEMLVSNFSAGIVGMGSAIFAYYIIGPIVLVVTAMLIAGVEVLIDTSTLALVAILVEPAKIFFLNNAINHGVFTPLGLYQVEEFGQSIFFMLEANPGPGLGILLAHMVFSKGQVRQTAAGATVIHFFGGIQEVYFPYVMMKPRLLVALILGSMAGIFTLTFFDSGLISPASPGSIVSILLMTPKDSYLGVIACVMSSTLVSFVSAVVLLKVEANIKPSGQKGEHEVGFSVLETIEVEDAIAQEPILFSRDNVFLGKDMTEKKQAIEFAGEQLVKLGHVEPEYIQCMLDRERLLSTYLGESIALPHGVIAGKQYIKSEGVVVCQFPNGVAWDEDGEDVAKLVVAIAARGERHIQMISLVSGALDNDESLEFLKTTASTEEFLRVINRI
ncbi:mannitol-specific PTS transporter subunit IIC [Vibrio astriarenae]|jgi:PTS system mannitol-specific IIC component